ncbi:hypothetical protein [Bacillus sp. CH30_1T]|uniref:hypothetical protein n=1 Tax=Bacillus sp. CH30_1T TaxID=2604836 RepID=UPI00165E3AE4|nr:hypothetical protein [Bacillus sp. CH30_1T]
MRVVLLVLVLLPISACSAGFSSSSQEERVATQTTEKQDEIPKARMASTTTSPSH